MLAVARQDVGGGGRESDQEICNKLKVHSSELSAHVLDVN